MAHNGIESTPGRFWKGEQRQLCWSECCALKKYYSLYIDITGTKHTGWWLVKYQMDTTSWSQLVRKVTKYKSYWGCSINCYALEIWTARLGGPVKAQHSKNTHSRWRGPLCQGRETNIVININAVALRLGKEWWVTADLYVPNLTDIILSA